MATPRQVLNRTVASLVPSIGALIAERNRLRAENSRLVGETDRLTAENDKLAARLSAETDRLTAENDKLAARLSAQETRSDIRDDFYALAFAVLPNASESAVWAVAQIAKEHRDHHGRIPNFWNPRTFNEKLQWMKLFNRDPRLPIYADKIAVKHLVAEKIGEHWVTPTLWSGDDPAKIPYAKLSPPYVIKTNHASGTNYFVHTVTDIRPDEIRDLMAGWLRSNFGLDTHEWHYLAITPGILIEPMLDVHGEIPPDFKFFVFSGKVHFIQVDVDRATDHRRAFFDINWRQQPFSLIYPKPCIEIPRPPHLSEMIAAAEEIGGEFSFARVDFYDAPQGPKFGEVTFFPEAGRGVFNPPQVDRLFGDLWKLPNRFSNW